MYVKVLETAFNKIAAIISFIAGWALIGENNDFTVTIFFWFLASVLLFAKENCFIYELRIIVTKRNRIKLYVVNRLRDLD